MNKGRLFTEEETEMIKALAYGMPIVDVANTVEMTEEEIERFAKDNAAAIAERKEMLEVYGL